MILRKVRVPAARSSRLPASFTRSDSLLRTGALWVCAFGLGVLALGMAAFGLSPIPEAATSLGSANRGVLLHALELPKSGRGFVRARPDDDTHFGTPALVSRITYAAAQ